MIIYLHCELGIFIGQTPSNAKELQDGLTPRILQSDPSNTLVFKNVVQLQRLPVPAQGPLGQTGIGIMTAMVYIGQTIRFDQLVSVLSTQIFEADQIYKQYVQTVREAVKNNPNPTH